MLLEVRLTYLVVRGQQLIGALGCACMASCLTKCIASVDTIVMWHPFPGERQAPRGRWSGGQRSCRSCCLKKADLIQRDVYLSFKMYGQQGYVEGEQLLATGSASAARMEAGSVQAAFCEAMAGLDLIRTWPTVQWEAALPPVDYRGANKLLKTLRLLLPVSASAASPRKRQRVPQLAARPARMQRPAERAKPSRGPLQSAIPPATLPADPVMSAHAASVHLFDLAGFRCAIARDVCERIRTAPLRPLPTILPPGPRHAARPAPVSASVTADSGAQQGSQSSAATAQPLRRGRHRQHDGLQRQAVQPVSILQPKRMSG